MMGVAALDPSYGSSNLTTMGVAALDPSRGGTQNVAGSRSHRRSLPAKVYRALPPQVLEARSFLTKSPNGFFSHASQTTSVAFLNGAVSTLFICIEGIFLNSAVSF